MATVVSKIETCAAQRVALAPEGRRRVVGIEAVPPLRAIAGEDFFSRSMPWLLLLVTLLPFIALGLCLVGIYIGVEYTAPPWNVHSVPAPRLY